MQDKADWWTLRETDEERAEGDALLDALSPLELVAMECECFGNVSRGEFMRGGFKRRRRIYRKMMRYHLRQREGDATPG